MIAPLTLQEVHESTEAGWARPLHTSIIRRAELDEALARPSALQSKLTLFHRRTRSRGEGALLNVLGLSAE